MMRRWLVISLGYLLALIASSTQAHQLSTAYLTLTGNTIGVIQGELQIRLYDIDQALAVDIDSDGKLLWGELQARELDVSLYISQHLSLMRGNNACTLIISAPWQIDSHFNEGYLVLPIHAQCAIDGELTIHYSAFFSNDGQHKLLVNFRPDDNPSSRMESRVMSITQPVITLAAANGSRWRSFSEFLYQGIIHIWIGIDHILFLFSLLLTCVLVRRNNTWVGRDSVRDITIHATWIVTAFTLAHSITLTATALGILHFPSRWVETGIALSVMFAAINNIFPLIHRLGWLTFCFGLLHGMGFAGALGELGIPADQQLLTVLAFNLGVEIGQMVIVLFVLPVLIAIRNTTWYARYSLVGISAVIALIALQWVFQRITG